MSGTTARIFTARNTFLGVVAASLLLVLALLPVAAHAANLEVQAEPASSASLIKALWVEKQDLDGQYGMSRMENMPGFGGATCVINNIACNSSVSGALTTSDCDLGNDFYADFWQFNGTSGQTVTIDMTSNDFDTFLSLLDPVPNVVANDDDGGSGTNSRIVFNLGQTGVWTIAPQHFFANDLGNYNLSLACSTSPGTCTPDANTLCLQDDRFRVETEWRKPNGETGVGTAVELTPDTGYFWFFNASNVEMVVKVLDNCNGFSNRFWVFAGGLTNVEVTMTVTDTQTGAVNVYTNPLGTPFQPIQDTSAFATCP